MFCILNFQDQVSFNINTSNLMRIGSSASNDAIKIVALAIFFIYITRMERLISYRSPVHSRFSQIELHQTSL